MKTPFATAPLVQALISARTTGVRLSEAQLQRPTSLSYAMAVQARVYEAIATSVAGWKVAIGPSARPVAAPLHPLVRDTTQPLPWRPGVGLEVEFAIELGANLPFRPSKDYSRDEIEAAVSRVYLGVEIIDSRLVEGSGSPFELFLADSLANGGYVLGPPIRPEFLCPDNVQALAIFAGTKPIYSGQACYPGGDPLAPLVAYVNNPSDQLGGLRAGQIITTGSLCGMIPLQAPAQLTIRLDDTIAMLLEFTSDTGGELDKLV
jgi:2-keto-4-pentenoate hydratase